MSGYRLDAPAGDAIDRSRQLDFVFNGAPYRGFAGDTLASALLAGGVRLVGRSFKYHRPRGIVACGVEEPTGLIDAGRDGARTPATRATDIALVRGLVAETGNAWPSVGFDLGAVNGLLGGVFAAGFYYKTFMWPNWQLFEPAIRRMAGLGHAGEGADPDRYDELSLAVDCLVVGGGLAGLEAAVAAAEAGREVMVLEGEAWLGGWASTIAAGADGEAALMREAITGLRARADRAGVRIRLQCTAVGMYDHGLVSAVELPSAGDSWRERLLKIRAGRIVLATGCFDRPMLFPDNDRPGVMFASGALRYAAHYGVGVGRRVVVATACDAGLETARRLAAAGIEVAAVFDRRAGECIVGVGGAKGVKAIRMARTDGSARQSVECDALLHVGGLTPNVSLHSQSGGGLRFDDAAAMFVPSRMAKNVASVGACAGAFDLDAALEHARRTARDDASFAAAAPVGGAGTAMPSNGPSAAALATLGRKPGKVFVDLQNDVTAADIALAARENYRSVEHVKRYTTTGMATDQGKTSNVNALVLLGAATGRAPGDVGTTKFRPPYKPVTLGAIVAGRQGERYRPLKRLPAHSFHVVRGALFEDFGGWWRPAAYLRPGELLAQAAAREAAHVRRSVGLFEGSPLGKIEVFGPDAAAFLDLMYVGTISTLPVGNARYGLLLDENGIVVDDGIVARLAPDRFWINTTSVGVDRTALAFDEWLQCEYVDLRVFVQPVTTAWGQVTVTGPEAWALLAAAGFDAALAPSSMKHMTIRETNHGGTTQRVLRASFSGELGYEINVPALFTAALIERLWQVGQAFDVDVYGIEALMLMRLEKGYIHVGADTDGTTQPQDIGHTRGIEKKKANFVGRRSLARPSARDPQRLQLVGLVPTDMATPIPVGAHIARAPAPARTEGHVTSAGTSPALGHPVALAMLAGGHARIGERLRLFHLGREIAAKVVATPFFDPEGARLRG